MSILHISTANVAYIHIYLHVRIINCADVCDRDHLVCCVKYHLHSSTSHHIFFPILSTSLPARAPLTDAARHTAWQMMVHQSHNVTVTYDK